MNALFCYRTYTKTHPEEFSTLGRFCKVVGPEIGQHRPQITKNEQAWEKNTDCSGERVRESDSYLIRSRRKQGFIKGHFK